MTTKKILYASWLGSVMITIAAVATTWAVVRTSMQRQNRLELDKFSEAAKVLSRAEWIAWHHSEIGKNSENFITFKALILLYEKRRLLNEARQLKDKSPNTVYAGQILHSIGVDTVEEYFLWAEKKMDRETSEDQEIRVDGYVFPWREIHESDGFQQFIKMSIIRPSSERLVFVYE